MNKRVNAYLVLVILLFVVSWSKSFSQLKEGQNYAELSKGMIWYDVVGKSDKTPLLLLHGGPGGTCYSLYPLAYLSDERQVILFDQPGGGRSYSIRDTTLMTMEYFVDQLHEFIDHLGLKEFYLYGHSWGTMLGLDYYLKYPDGIKALIFNSPLVSTQMWERDADTLIMSLADSVQDAIRVNEEKKSYDSPDYQFANKVYYKNFIRRKPRIKTEFDVERVAGNNVIYNYMWGPTEFTATGTLKNYDRLDSLKRIKVPTLYITGEFDEARPATVNYYHSLVPGSIFKVIEGAAHATMHDNPEENIRVIRDFIDHVEAISLPCQN